MPITYDFIFIKSMLIASVLLFFGGTSIFAQQTDIKRSHALSSNDHIMISPSQIQATGTLNILAVRVSFLPDDNRLTSGNGTFEPGSLPYLEENDTSIDPLPHDQAYFEAHLEFAKNYFEKVSGGQLSVDYEVLPDIYQLDQQMEYYSPTGENFTNEKLALLARDVWQKVEEHGGFDATGLNPQNTAFVIFHAGVGRDIELTGTSLDKTPQDIPSLYLSTQSLANLLNDPNFNGFPVNNGSFRITNSLILPRTLSRRGVDVSDSEFVLQLSTNGLITATLGSHLGLPDLFNTQTGASGIGRFGLMDGAAIFSYSGLFPPEPSAWEKIYLGWTSPFEIDMSTSSPVQLSASSLHQTNSSVAKHALSNSEYFLVENRHRDTENDGAILTIRQPDGTEIQQRYDNSDEAFVNQASGFEEELTPGVLVNVDNFDWSLPGGLDRGPDEEPGTPDDRLLNGGMLIWHIDEAIIQQQISGGGVNANPERRGVDLEEADGAQDIGRPIDGQTTNFSTGTAFDFWWAGNDASVISTQGDTLSLYENKFGSDTHPNNDSNSGAPTFFEFYDFSGIGPTTTFRVRGVDEGVIESVMQANLPGDQAFTPQNDSYWNSYPLSLATFSAQQDSFLVIPTGQTTYALQINSQSSTFHDFQTGAPQQPYAGQSLILAEKPGNDSSIINAWRWDGSKWQNEWTNSARANSGFLSSQSDDILLLDFTDQRFNLTDGSPLSELSTPQQQSATVGGNYAILSQNELRVEGTDVNTSVMAGSSRKYTGGLQLTSGQNLFYLMEDDAFYLIDPQSENPKRLLFESENYGWPAFADFDHDNRLDILFVNNRQNRLDAVNANGAFLNSFPIHVPQGAQFTGTPLVTDLDGDQSLDLIATVQDSVSMNLIAYNQNGTMKEGFPLYLGAVTQMGNQPIHPVIFGEKLYAVSHEGDLKAWRFPALQDTRWGSRYGNEPFNKVTGRLNESDPPQMPSSILVDSETYNWPNPAQDETYIRYQTSGSGSVEIRIITASGRVIFDEDFETSGGAPEEQRISTAEWGSGIYLAQVTATVNGQESSKLIKIAVVH
ncbi:T9SS type A sorting domain-containing protein [Aliifodinibius sp. S!AR15-10]|uniref:T9SS-dependent M6-like inactivated metalloprotease n=1 Tax=Aliifodinibius sp. S!AR15-10 TaxID=2950437 RepID=UPI002856E1B3|nr:T9SS type A sorting domain-containing protein [Aliifodinibius sp. S!AR15-10]MDR8392156.1 T9SS type A sorting domain-containing protein [Aliifodinibius sp. S!AR15-10]